MIDAFSSVLYVYILPSILLANKKKLFSFCVWSCGTLLSTSQTYFYHLELWHLVCGVDNKVPQLHTPKLNNFFLLAKRVAIRIYVI